MFRREVIEDYKETIDTPEEMIGILSKIRDHLLKQFAAYHGWGVEDTIILLDMVLRLNKEIRHFEWVISERQRLSMPN